MHAFREQGRPSPRILYWFRTPPNVRVGRGALDEDAIRLIEETHPDVVFDWTRILKSAAAPEPAGSPGRRHPRRAKPARTAGSTEAERRPVAGTERVEVPPAAHHVEERVGRAGSDRLRARYAELLTRITERVTDPVRLEELRAEAERLNPDTWVTDDEARQGIEGFNAAYEALRARLGRRRRRRRGGARRRRDRQGTGEPERSAETPAESTDLGRGKPQV